MSESKSTQKLVAKVPPLTILHIASYYTGQRLYSNLVSSLNKYGVSQRVFIPVRAKNEIGKFEVKSSNTIKYSYANVLKPYHRLLYFTKIRRTFNMLKKSVDLTAVEFAHAHSLFSDGGIALKVKEEFGIPYIVAVRNTDLNGFFRFMPHLRPFALKILRQANNIIFINPSYREQLFNRYIPQSDRQSLLRKSICVPNGIDDYWHANLGVGKVFSGKNLNLLYVGTFIARKNVPLTIAAALQLNKRYHVTLTIVGGSDHRHAKNEKLLQTIERAKRAGLSVRVVGKVDDQQKLKEFYRESHIFMMPSRNETFGLVYIEALSQGTPIVYSANDGVDGFFPVGEVGYAVRSFSVDEVVDGVNSILDNYDSMSKRCAPSVQAYQWDKISQNYMQLYRGSSL